MAFDIGYKRALRLNTKLTYNSIVYNTDNKLTEITNYNGETTYFSYDSSGMRYKQVTDKRTTYYIGSFEVEIDSQTSEHISRAYIGDYAVLYREQGKAPEIKFLHKDSLGSIDTITDAGTPATVSSVAAMSQEQRYFNVFGRMG